MGLFMQILFRLLRLSADIRNSRQEEGNDDESGPLDRTRRDMICGAGHPQYDQYNSIS